MEHEVLLKPCIYVYHGVIFILKLIGNFLKYFFLGLKRFPSLFANMLGYSTLGIRNIFSSSKHKNKSQIQNVDESSSNKAFVESKKTAEETKTEKKTQDESEEYINDNSNFLYNEDIPKKESLIKKIIDTLNKGVGGTKKNINLPELKINFDGDDAKKSKTKQTYEYLIENPEGKIVKGYFNAYSKVEVHSFLVSEGNKVYKIETNKWINLLHGNNRKSMHKFKTKDLIFFLAQLSTYLKAGIALADACKILSKQFKETQYKRILQSIVYDLSVGLSFSEALAKQGETFPTILINMVKTAEMTGELPETLDDMEEYFSEMEATRKAMITAMMYPAIIFIIAIGVGTFIMLYVVPKFVDIYNSMDNANIPAITLIVLGLSDFLKKYIIYIGIALVLILLLLIYLYKNGNAFKRTIQYILMHLPVFGNVIIYNEVTTFTKTFSSLLSHNVFITDSMQILDKVTNNEIYKEMIHEAINSISKGKPISSAFKNHWAFPIPAYQMIVTGEKTGQLPEMMKKVSNYYQDLHKNSVTRIKTFIEPVLIIMLTAIVGVIVLSIVIPMFQMYSNIQA